MESIGGMRVLGFRSQGLALVVVSGVSKIHGYIRVGKHTFKDASLGFSSRGLHLRFSGPSVSGQGTTENAKALNPKVRTMRQNAPNPLKPRREQQNCWQAQQFRAVVLQAG